MSFKFNFDIDDIDQENDIFETIQNEKQEEKRGTETAEPFRELKIEDLIPLSSGKTRTIARRDLFDARFQLISEGTGVEDIDKTSPTDEKNALTFIDQPSDLVPWVYEGGLKTWECSLDLVDHFDKLKQDGELSVDGKRILEIGCGTAVPSMHLLSELFSASPLERGTEFHLQDYNTSALELVTFPNALLAWYMSPASEAFRNAQLAPVEGEEDSNVFPPPDPTVATEIPITDELKTAFQSSLRERHIALRFFSGSWSAFDVEKIGGKYDIILTSETIYRMESVPSLIDLLYHACEGQGGLEPLRIREDSSYLCLVAAKVFYFGVGGGITEFVASVKRSGTSNRTAKIETVWEQSVGVSRKILRLSWKEDV